MAIYGWPDFVVETEHDRQFVAWAMEVQTELETVQMALGRALPDEPTQIDREVTEFVEGWLPRVAALAVTSEFFLSQAKLEKWPDKVRANDGKPITTEKDREVVQEAALAQYRWVRNRLDAYVTSMRDRMRWAQSVRKQHAEGQAPF
jgi:hypothetical protein